MERERDREAITSLLLPSCMDAMAELMELVGSSCWMKGSRVKTTGREERVRGCS
jgi:hypothetical protein